MFRLNQTALLSIQLLVTCQFCAETNPVDQRSILVYRGDPVMFTCNRSRANTTLISWTKGSTVFIHVVSQNRTFSNLTSHRLRIDLNLPSRLNISNAEHDDAGLYTCTVSDINGEWTTEWNLTVSEKPEEISPSWYLLYILTSVIGLLLCGISPVVCLCRKSWTRTPNQDLVNDRTLSYALFRVQLRGESLQVAPPQPQSCAEYRMNHKQREPVL